jgi:hypothetical protein
MSGPLIVICPRRRLAAPAAEVASALRAAGLDRQLHVFRSEAAAISGMQSA